MKVYIAGKITDNPNYKNQFDEAEQFLLFQGHTVMSPSVLSVGFEHYKYMKICFSMIDVCEGIFMLDNWRDSAGAKMEYSYALRTGKKIMFQKEVPYECQGNVFNR